MGILSVIRSGASFSDIIMYTIAIVLVVAFILPFHELAHGYIAYKLGDNTAKYSGRLTLNPLAHIDPFGALALFLVGFGWAKPVPVNPVYFKNPKRDMALTALAGPVANLIAALLGGFLYQIFLRLGWFYVVMLMIFYIRVNVFLAVFNLIPIPPLDGSKILMRFLPNSVLYNLQSYEKAFYIGLIVMLFTGLLDVPIDFVVNSVLKFISWFTALPF